MFYFLSECTKVLLKGKVPGPSVFKYFRRWRYLRDKSPVNVKQPWLTFEAIDFISKSTRESDKVFEYGGGGSTLYFLDKVAEVVTVEHDREWFDILHKKIAASGSSTWKGQLILPEKDVDTSNLDRSRPWDYFTADPAFQDATFKTYSTFICQFEDEYFDLVLIDGRARASCLHHAIPKVKIGGLLLLDNAEREYYLQENIATINQHYKLLLNEMGPVPYSPHFSQTAIWQRIK